MCHLIIIKIMSEIKRVCINKDLIEICPNFKMRYSEDTGVTKAIMLWKINNKIS